MAIMTPRERRCLAIVLAAGEGTRMKSARPKALHEIAGRAMVGHVLKAAAEAGAEALAIVAGPDHDRERLGAGFGRGFEDVTDHGAAGDFVQSLGARRFHARAFAGGENDRQAASLPRSHDGHWRIVTRPLSLVGVASGLI